MLTLAFANRKGGTGKTTSAVNLAACLAEAGKQVVLIDLDPQANATTALGAKRAKDNLGSQTLFTEQYNAATILVDTPQTNLRLLPAGSDLAALEFNLGERNPKWHSSLARGLSGLDNQCEIIVLDCPPALGTLTVAALVAASGVIIPLQCDYFSLEGLAEFARNISQLRASHNRKLMLYGLLKTMYDPRTLLTRQVSEEIDRHFGTKVFATKIPRNVRLAEAPSHGLPINLYDPKSKGAIAYHEVAKELLKKLT